MDAWTGKADPYVVLSVDGVTMKTETKRRTLEPVWEEDVYVDCVAGESRLTVQVFDQVRVIAHLCIHQLEFKIDV